MRLTTAWEFGMQDGSFPCGNHMKPMAWQPLQTPEKLAGSDLQGSTIESATRC